MFTLKKDMTVYKSGQSLTGRKVLITLKLPAGTLCRFNPREKGREEEKNRSNRARVVRIEGWRGAQYMVAKPIRYDYTGFQYDVGKLVRPERAFDRGDGPCESGIHFFTSVERARSYARSYG